ncbi:MAG: hypothetical protein ABJA82_02800 [Myxococcales bacterium]
MTPTIEAVLRALVREEVAAALAAQQPTQEVPVNDDGPLLDLVDAAALAGMTAAALRARAYRGTIPVTRIGRSLRFKRSDIIGG